MQTHTLLRSVIFTALYSLLLLCTDHARAADIDQEGLPETGLDTSTWTTGVLPPLRDMWCALDFQMAAKNVMAKWQYVSFRTGAVNEVTYQANLNIWSEVRLNGFTFKDVSHVNLSTAILGYNFTTPFFIAPAASAGSANVAAELSLAQAAGEAGIMYAPSISSTKTLEEIAAVKLPNQTMFHQEYIWTNNSRNVDQLNRIKAADYKAIFLTVDNPGISGIRTRLLRLTGPSPDTGNYLAFDLTSLAAFRNLTDLPIVPKGIKTWQDAKRCLELGFPAIYISNHGGRILDTAPTSLEVILDIHKHAPEVMTSMEVYADGGIRTGTDILKLLALGVRAVGLGRAPMFANIYGKPGVDRLIALLIDEMETEMALLGVNIPAELNGDYINTKLVEQKYIR